MMHARGVRAAVDATPLFGARTGVAALTLGTLETLLGRPELDVEPVAYALTWRGRGQLASLVPAGLKVVGHPLPARALRWVWKRADVPRAEWWTGPVDVVHGTNFVVPPSRRAAGIVTVHDLTPLHFPELCRPDTLAYPGLVRRALARGAWVHTPSAFVAGEVVDELGADPDRVVAVAPGIPTARAPEGASAPSADAPLHPPYVLFLGTLEPRKDVPALVRAFDEVAPRHPDLRLVIAGADGWGAAELSRTVDRARHRERIVRLGWVADGERVGLLRGAAVFAFPSRYEGFGFPPLEAMGAGVPVVATACGSLPEVLGDAALLVPAGDTEALAAGLDRVLADEGLRSGLAAASLARAESFSWERYGTGIVDLYRRAVKDARA